MRSESLRHVAVYLTNHGCFDYWKNPKIPNLSPTLE